MTGAHDTAQALTVIDRLRRDMEISAVDDITIISRPQIETIEAALLAASAPAPQEHVTVEEVAAAMFKTDWPRDDWSRFGPKDHAPERYRAMARVALGMLNTPSPSTREVGTP